MEKMLKVPIMMIAVTLSIFLVAGSAGAVVYCPTTPLTSADCGCVANLPGQVYTLAPGGMTCTTRHGIIIGAAGVTIDGNGETLDGGGVTGRNCEVLVAPEEVATRMWCVGHPCRQASDGNVLDSGIVNANTSLGNSCNAAASMGQGGCDDLTVKNLKITGWCDGIWVSGDCEPDERRLTGIVIEGNCIYDNGNDACGAYTPCPAGDGGDWANRYYNDAIFTAQIGMDATNSPTEYPCPECIKDTDKEFPDLVADGTNCKCQSDNRNIIWHNKIYGQKGCACVSCPGGNGINLQGGLEIEGMIWCGCNEIEKNVVKNCSVSGIHFTHATTYNRIHGNYLLGNGLGGIANGCCWCDNSYIYDNVAKGNYGVGIAVAAATKVKNNIVTDTVAVKNPEYKKLGYGPLPGDGIMTVSPGSELLGNTSVGNAIGDTTGKGKDIKDTYKVGGVPTPGAYGDENMCQTTANYDDDETNPGSKCRFKGGARLNCRGDLNHDCKVGFQDFTILGGDWGSGECCPCAE